MWQNRSDGLEKNLQRELDGAAAVEEAHRVVQIDVVACRQDDRSLGVVPRALERLVTPLLDSIALGHVYELEFCRRHSAALPPWGSVSLAYSSNTTYRTSPFRGDCVEEG